MAQLIPISPMGAAGRQIVETAVNPLTVYADARAKAEEANMAREAGQMRLEQSRNALAEYQREQRVRGLSQRAMSGDAEARQALMAEAPEALEANIRRVQGALKDNAPTLLPVVGRAVQMAQDGATPEQIHQYMRQQDTGALDLIFGPAGGFGVEDATPEALMQFGEQLMAAQPPQDIKRSWQTINGRRVLVDDRTGETVRDAGEAGDTSSAPRTVVRNIGGVDKLIDLNTGRVISEIGPSGDGGGPVTEVETVNPDGTTSIVRVGGRGTGGTGDKVRDRQINTKLDQYARIEGQMDEYGRVLFSNLPPSAAGIAGEIRRGVTGLTRQANGIPGAEQLTSIMRRAGVVPSTRDNAKVSEVRMRAQMLYRQLVPLFQDDTRMSDADARAAEGLLNLLNTTGNLEDARMAYTILRDMVRTQKAYYQGQMGVQPGAPATPQQGPRPVVPPQGGAAQSSGRPANWSQMTPAQKAAWLRGN